MQVSTAVTPQYDRVATQRMFNDLAVDLSRHDAKLEGMVRSGNSVGAGWEEWFDATSNRLLVGRDAYLALNPHDVELSTRLGTVLIDFTQNGGRIASAQDRRATLGHGWADALDGTIDAVQEAANRLYGSAAPVPVPGDPMGRPPLPPAPSTPVGVIDAARAAYDLVQQSLDEIHRVPPADRGSAATKETRVRAYDLNKQAQLLLEQHFGTADAATVSQLRTADASLEDASWQLTNQPSPDGRFTGVDIPGAVRDSRAALDVLGELGAIGG
jgi:hypothetical protein